MAVGPGWGGRKPCVTESDAAMGMPTYTSGRPVEAARVKTMGISSTNPAL